VFLASLCPPSLRAGEDDLSSSASFLPFWILKSQPSFLRLAAQPLSQPLRMRPNPSESVLLRSLFGFFSPPFFQSPLPVANRCGVVRFLLAYRRIVSNFLPPTSFFIEGSSSKLSLSPFPCVFFFFAAIFLPLISAPWRSNRKAVLPCPAAHPSGGKSR